MWRTILVYALALSLAAALLEWLQYRYLVRAFPGEFYIGLIAAGFVALGIWVGNRLTPRSRSEPFKQDSDYFPADRTAMVNLRVSDLDGLLAEFRVAGIEITREETMDGVGRFARVHDPEGNPIELWKPVQSD